MMRSRPLLIFNSLNKLISYQGYKKYLTCLGDQLNTALIRLILRAPY